MKAFLLTVFTLLSFASLASALTQTETFDTSVPSAANPGTINFTGLGLAPADVTAIDLAFTYEFATAASHELPLPKHNQFNQHCSRQLQCEHHGWL